MDDLLFQNGELTVALEAKEQKINEAVEAVPEDHILQADVNEWAAALAEETQIQCPELDLDNVWRGAAQDVRVDVRYDRSRFFSPGADTTVPGTRVVIHVPFLGDSDIFALQPSQYTYNPPRGRVEDRELLQTVEYPNDRPQDIDEVFKEFLDHVEQWLGWAKKDIETFNKTLPQRARAIISSRRRRLEERNRHLAQSSIPLRRPEPDGKTRVADVIVRRPAPKLPRGARVQLEPVLEEKIFEHILYVIRMQVAEILRAPETYSQLDEEERRDLFLAVLNTHYEGRGSAEAFNQSGKTDILIRFEERNLFIAEFKFWSGVKNFLEAIEQLFGYASWRDTKLALVMFVREKALTGVIEKAGHGLKTHARFSAWEDAANETELRVALSWPGDDRRLAELNIFFVHTPA